MAVDPKLMAILGGPAMLVGATRGAGDRARIVRFMGARPDEDRRRLDLFASRLQWPRAVDALRPAASLALTVSQPSTYETYQVKGRVVETAPAEAADLSFAEAYVRLIREHLLGLGVGERQLSCWFNVESLVRVRLDPQSLFAQTPGPGAGRSLGGAAP